MLPAALLTCTAALYNRFPLTYADSGGYLENALALIHGRAPWFFYRPPVYGAFLAPFATPQTIWLVPVAQGLLVAFLVDLTLRAAAVALSTRGFLALFAGLSAFTSLPWFSAQIMPDIFTSVVILLCFVSVWGDERHTRSERLLADGLLAIAIGSHLSHFLLYGILVVETITARMLVDRTSRKWRRFGPLALRALVPLAIAAGFLIGANAYFYRAPALSRSSSLFALAHMVDNGLAQRYLAKVCPTQQYLLCSEQADLRPNLDWFLWDAEGTWKRHEPELDRGDSTFLREASAIVAGTLRQEWPAVIRTSLRNTVVQLGTFGLQAGELGFSNAVAQALELLGPGTLGAYRASAQVRNSLPLEAASHVQMIVVALGVLVLLTCLPALRRCTPAPIRGLVATVCLGVVCNALVIASLATVHPRYQSRVVWLVPLIGAVVALEVGRSRARRTAAMPTAPRIELP